MTPEAALPGGLPRAAAPFVSFASLLRANAFAVAPEQTESFLAAVGLLGPRGMSDIHRAALAVFGPPPERREVFDALYRAHFLGQTLASPAVADAEDAAYEPDAGEDETFEPEEMTEAGGEASTAEVLAGRTLRPGTEDVLRRFARAAPAALPRRRSRRLGSQRHGERPDMRRALREAVRNDGELVRLPELARRTRQRRILLLIDVSGSMKGQTEDALRLAHALARAAERFEAFTIGTRLTRITRAMRHRSQPQALAAASAAVSDWDGGTRLGDALSTFLAIPRYAGFARSAAVIVFSDGLERGDPAPLVAAVRRLSRLASRIVWLSPLASGPSFSPKTEALATIAPYLDRIGDASSLRRATEEILDLSRP